ncbi:MAG: hypothetical protein ACRECX_02650 [Methyloceanibacter sp.]|uniref:hypothetical protein n=1 Tax=Methyloceanibacter sp. TaxID=1965321 RepID=UPI003D6C94A3
MAHSLIKATVAAFAFGAFGLVVPVFAVPLVPLDGTSAVIPIIDEETAVEEALEPDVMLPGSQEGAGGGHPPAESGGGGDGSAGEIPALEEAFPETNWPPSDRKE